MPIPSRRPFKIGELQFQILNRTLVEITIPVERYALISITDSEQNYPRIPQTYNTVGILKIKFDDIQQKIHGMILFDENHAVKILDFFQKMQAQNVSTFLINCEMGRCRSAAVAAALAETAGCKTSWFDRRFEPNKYVREMLLQVHNSAKTSRTLLPD